MIVLVGLRLENIALIDSLELSFDKGLTVLTGQTGTGKSILLDALDALFCGSQASSGFRLIRTGHDKGLIEAIFSKSQEVKSWLGDHQFDLDDMELSVTREIRLKDDRQTSRWRVNGTLVNRKDILSLRPLLLDLTIQGQIHNMTDSSYHLGLLDDFGFVELESMLLTVRSSWKAWKAASTELEDALRRAKQFSLEYENSLSILQELDAANLADPFEDKKIEREQDRLANGVRLQEGLSRLFNHLHESCDQSPSILDRFSLCVNELQAMTKMDQDLNSELNLSLEIISSIQELISKLNEYTNLIDTDTERLNLIQERLAFLKRLQRFHGLEIQELLKLREELRSTLENVSSDKLLDELHIKEVSARKIRDENNKQLSSLRKKIATDIQACLLEHLRPMGLLNAHFQIQFFSVEPNEFGIDKIEFMFSANPGHPLAPIAEVASGGEMSRFLLALKLVLAEVTGSSTFFFDEIDSGVSGRISFEIAKILKRLSKSRQVFCVTHQPMVAAAADHHFSVSKSVSQGLTSSKVIPLTNIQDRQKELADLAGGDLAEAQIYAAGLLEQHVA